MVDDVDSFVTIARLLKERGAYKIYVMATHGLLSAEAPRLIEDSPIDEVKGKMILTIAVADLTGTLLGRGLRRTNFSLIPQVCIPVGCVLMPVDRILGGGGGGAACPMALWEGRPPVDRQKPVKTFTLSATSFFRNLKNT